jgi:hypothetical protein
MRYCSACKSAEGVNHITVTVDVFGPKTNRQKLAQFWLCAACEKRLTDFMARDEEQRGRVAKGMCPAKDSANSTSKAGDADK